MDIQDTKKFSKRDLVYFVYFGILLFFQGLFSVLTYFNHTSKIFWSTHWVFILYAALDLIAVLFFMFVLESNRRAKLLSFLKMERTHKIKYAKEIFEDIGFKKGMILKQGPFFIATFFVIISFGILMSEPKFNLQMFFSIVSVKAFLYYAMSSLTLSVLLMYGLYSHFENIYGSKTLTYIYSVAVYTFFDLLIGYLVRDLVLSNENKIIMVIIELVFLFVLMILMYEYSDFSIYYAWIVLTFFLYFQQLIIFYK